MAAHLLVVGVVGQALLVDERRRCRSGRSTCSISGGSKKVLTGTRTPPASATPKAATTHSGRLPMSRATRVPLSDARGRQRLGEAAGLAPELGVGPADDAGRPPSWKTPPPGRPWRAHDLVEEPAEGERADAGLGLGGGPVKVVTARVVGRRRPEGPARPMGPVRPSRQLDLDRPLGHDRPVLVGHGHLQGHERRPRAWGRGGPR